MKLPVLFPNLPSQRFDCHSCTNCCRDLVVHLTEADRQQIKSQQWADKIGAAPYVRLGRSYVLNHRPGGGCVFLRDDGRCQIHNDFGATAKPLACQLYPFSLERDGDLLRASLRFDCPSVARNKGAPIAEHKSSVSRLAVDLDAADYRLFTRPSERLLLRPDRPLSDFELNKIVTDIDDWLKDADRPLIDRLFGLESLIQMLAEARLAKIHGEAFAELVTLLVGDLPRTVDELRQTPIPPPTPRQLVLLKQTVFAHCEHVTLEQARASWWTAIHHRWSQLARARRLVAAKGDLPALVPGLGGPTCDAVDLCLPGSTLPTGDCEQLVTRYLRFRIVSHSAFGPAYYDWPVLDGLRALLLSVAAIGWLTRYLAAAQGRNAFNVEDVIRAIGIVDRNSGRARELGAASARLRIRYLSERHGLASLLVAYPIGASHA